MSTKTIETLAIEFIAAIASNMSEAQKPLKQILDTLEDGEALACLGATDDDQLMVEEAHSIVSAWLDVGYESYEEASSAGSIGGEG